MRNRNAVKHHDVEYIMYWAQGSKRDEGEGEDEGEDEGEGKLYPQNWTLIKEGCPNFTDT